MARKFTKVLKQIKKVAPEDLANALEKSAGFWAPEAAWSQLSLYVNKYVTPSSTNETSVAVYAILLGCSKSKMRARFRADGH